MKTNLSSDKYKVNYTFNEQWDLHNPLPVNKEIGMINEKN